jgi:peptidoglycan/xylan/chitin deacetylase (PgdA/CDA1 family)
VSSVPQDDRDTRAPVSRYLRGRGYEPEYPDGRRFAVVLTHDVDSIRPSKKRAAISALRCAGKGRFGEAWSQVARRSGGADIGPYRRFADIMDLEERFGGRSTFFFMTSGPDDTGAGYPPREVAPDIASIKGRGWEIGLHGGYVGYTDPSVMVREKVALEAITGGKVEGFRNHYLRFKAPDSWLAVEKAGFRYDSTVGHADRWGFRNGLAMPYRPYDFASSRELDLVEVPLALMDTTLFGYSRLDPQRSWEVARQLLREAAEVRGTLVVLWHNDTFANPKLSGYADIYGKLLKEASEKNGWLCSAGDAAKWWEAHNE